MAAGGTLEGEPPPPSGHAIEARLNAEDPGLGFAPTPGRITLLRLPGGPGIRVDSGFAEGDLVPAEFDSMIAKIIAHGRTREEAIARLRRAIADTMVVIEEGTTNQGFLLELLGRRELRDGEVDTGWLDRLQVQGEVQSKRHADVALVRAAIELCDDATATERGRFYAFARRGPARGVRRRRGAPSTCATRARVTASSVSQIGPHRYVLEIDDSRIEAELERVSEHERLISFGAGAYRTLTALQDADLLVEVDGVPHRISRDEGGLIRCPSPGVVVAIPVSAGDEVQAGDVVAVTESMKMESSLTAPVRGRVREVLVSAEHPRPVRAAAAADRAAGGSRGRRRGRAASLRAARDSRRAPSPARSIGWSGCCSAMTSRSRRRAGSLDEFLERSGAIPPPSAGCWRSTRTCARSAAPTAPTPRARSSTCTLSCARSTPPLRVCPSGSWPVSSARCAITGSVAWSAPPRWKPPAIACFCRANAPAPRAARSAQSSSAASNRRATARPARTASCARYSTGWRPHSPRPEPGLAELAREVRWRCCDQPLIEEGRQDIYGDADEHIAALAVRPDDDGEEHVQALVDCPQPLAPRVFGRIDDASPKLREQLLEAMTRRYYRIGRLEGVEHREAGGVRFATTSFEHGGRRYRVAAAFAATEELEPTLRALGDMAGTLSRGRAVTRRRLRVADRFARGSRRAVGAARRAAGGGAAPGGDRARDVRVAGTDR